ncbi:MAG: hypothetical protein J7K48_08530 [Thermococcus sp.]|nr:hypothetical protein [Thermococcus sp.]
MKSLEIAIVDRYSKKILTFGIVVLIFGLVINLPMTLATEVQNNTSPRKQTSCTFSGNGTYSRQITEIRGPTLYLEAISIFNRNNSLNLVRQVRDIMFFPKYSLSKEILVKINGTSTQALVIPLVGSEGKIIGKYYYVHNSEGSAYALVVFKNESSAVIHISNGTAIKTFEVIKEGNQVKVLGLSGWLSCARCVALGTFVCGSAMAFAGSLGCWTGCPMFSWLGPLAVAVCFIICEIATIVGSAYSCYEMSKTACTMLGKC